MCSKKQQCKRNAESRFCRFIGSFSFIIIGIGLSFQLYFNQQRNFHFSPPVSGAQIKYSGKYLKSERRIVTVKKELLTYPVSINKQKLTLNYSFLHSLNNPTLIFHHYQQNQSTSDSIPIIFSVWLTLKYLLKYCFIAVGVIL